MAYSMPTIARLISVGWGGLRNTEVAQGDPLRRVNKCDVGREEAVWVRGGVEAGDEVFDASGAAISSPKTAFR
jgi:hypothetical protein